MLFLYAITIFVRNWHVIAGSEMLPVLRLNEPNRGNVPIKGTFMDQRGERRCTACDARIHTSAILVSIRAASQLLEPPNAPLVFKDCLRLCQPAVGQRAGIHKLLSGELFRNKSGVHLPSPDLLHTEHCRLRVTDDFLQTAVDAFAIILEGGLADVRALPGSYVLRSARTISLMKIPREKLSAMWDVVLAGRKPNTITYETLEIYRPLFKYLSGKQIARLNLSNSRIVNYIGTHPELTRHQVGVVASKYIKLNEGWRHPKYLNNMNNLLCGVPMTFMRKIEDSAYQRLEQQVFYHIRACDPLQRRFFLNLMTRTQALGKSFSWSARDVSRLGLLMAEVEGPALAAISPEALTGISSHVMAEMRPENLKYFTEMQVSYIKPKARNILSRKLREYDARMVDSAYRIAINVYLRILLFTLTNVILAR